MIYLFVILIFNIYLGVLIEIATLNPYLTVQGVFLKLGYAAMWQTMRILF